jgi:hypothetical protein
MTDTIDALPSEPLSRSTVRRLNAHERIGICWPVYQLEEEPDGIISLLLEAEDSISVLLFDGTSDRWKRIDRLGDVPSLADDIELSEAADRRFDDWYEDEEIEPAEPLHDPMAGFAGSLPQEPLSEDQLDAVQEQEFIIQASSFFERTGDGRCITVVLVFDDQIESRTRFGSYGYDPEAERWHLLDTADTTGEDDDIESPFEPFSETTIEWIDERYDESEYVIAEDPDLGDSPE